jgi:CheY-like chemotaxis protein
MGFGEILEKTNLSTEQKEVVEIISLASKKLMNILNDVLDVAKFNDGMVELELKTINLHQLTQEIILLQGVKAREKNIDLQYIIHENVPQFIIGDETRLNQILINLINNAIKFTQIGWVKLEVCEVHRDNLNTQIQFKISDSGIGIPIEKQSVIFDRFVQAEASTSRKYGGTGLGLSIVKSLIELYHGTISLHSDGKNGTQFTVELPFQISNINLTKNPIKLIQKDTAILNNKKVLLVEDNDFNQILAKNILQQYNMQVDIAEDGFVALEFVRNKSYDIILMDLQMPNLDGYSTAKIMINDLAITTPIIACSAHAQKKEKEECKKIGMVDYLSKPYSKIDLIDIIGNHIQPNFANHFSIEVLLLDIQDGIQKVKTENGLDLFKILSDLYIQRIPSDLKQIELFIQQKNWEELIEITHKLIGSFGTMNFYEACKICKKIENNLKSGIYTSVHQDIEVLSSYIHNSLKVLNSL